jgi:GDP-D-mannose dehydratase
VVHECDLTDLSSVIRTLKKSRPDVIFHLASHANVRAGFDVPLAVLQNNIAGTANLFEGIRLVDLDPIVLLCSTSEVYGAVRKEDVPIVEECPLKPVSPYAVSKTAQDLLGFSYFISYGVRIIRTRMFAYLNPRRADLFATSFARQVALIEAGLQDELVHGNLDSTRTMVDVRDAMRAYWMAAERCTPGEVYNIGGTTVITVGEFLRKLCGLAHRPIPTRVDPRLLRPADVTLQVPDVSRFARATGWTPEHDFDASLMHLLTYWRESVARLGVKA